MQTIKINPAVREKLSGTRLAKLRASAVEVVEDGYDFEKRITDAAVLIKQQFGQRPVSDDPVVSAVRRMYRRVGWEPTKYRPSSEAMVRRLLKDKGLYSINNVVDLLNLVSLQRRVPAGLYDLDKIEGEIMFDVGRTGESYQGISKSEIHAEGKIILRDERGVFGNPTADSRRTAIGDGTKNLLAIFFVPQGLDKAYATETLAALKALYVPYCHGEIEQAIQNI